ncbi:MAG: DUF5681 domain-containing protein [Pseudomonadota bacterium]
MSKGTDEEVGYGRPPVSTRFPKGKSGNPRGRPRGRTRDIPYDAALGQKVTIRDGGRDRQVTAAEAFLLQLAKQGIEGDSAAARQTLASIEEARAKHVLHDDAGDLTIVRVLVAPGRVSTALEPLRIGRKLDRYRPTARMALEPWIVEAALDRLGARRLTPAEQQTVLKATRTPRKVNWPDWWTELPE